MKTTTHILVTIVLSAATSLAVVSVMNPETSPVSDSANINDTISTDGGLVPSVVASATPAVVSVVITADVPVVEQYYEQYDPFGGFFGNGISIPRQRQIGTEQREIGGGTGFFVSSDGYLVTNRHVVDTPNASYSVVTNEGQTFSASVIAKDPLLDIAILKVEATTTFPYLTFGDAHVTRPGETVIAIGNALGEFPNTVSVGVVSGLSRNIIAGDGQGMTESLEGVIQTDAAINQGNSGGPLLNAAGKVIGVNVAVAGNGENIGFALPANVVSQVYNSVATTGTIVRPYLGIRFVQIDKALAKTNNLPVAYGVIIRRGQNPGELAVLPGSAADKAGLVENDILLAVDSHVLDGSRSLPSLLRDYSVGDTIAVRVLHDGIEKTVSVTLEQAPNQ
ncbi:trypsin-like peptidase domain-containing protein [Candidatus Kaiserbacteria bacterium]|nr:trypsin-like peptidase domain-containing protein [Candidatus Kaiserbacteria bacterium]